MKAAVLRESGGVPVVEDVDRPGPVDGGVLVDVAAAGINPHDLVVAAGVAAPAPVPYVPGVEGVGRTLDGVRVYFGWAITPHGSFAERAVAARDAVQPIPDELSDGAALAVGAAGVSAFVPLTWKARLQPGETVLVLGATGAVGRIGVQVAKLLGASTVVAAGRNHDVLAELRDLGADEVVALEDDYPAELRRVAGDGFDVVLDTLFGEPMVAALSATRSGGRLVNVGMRAGRRVDLSGLALKGRDLLTYSGNDVPAEIRRAAFSQLADYVVAGRIRPSFRELGLDDVAKGWKSQAESPGTKLILRP